MDYVNDAPEILQTFSPALFDFSPFPYGSFVFNCRRLTYRPVRDVVDEHPAIVDLIEPFVFPLANPNSCYVGHVITQRVSFFLD